MRQNDIIERSKVVRNNNTQEPHSLNRPFAALHLFIITVP